MTTPDPTVFERCVEAADASALTWGLEPPKELVSDLTRAVLTALRDHTPSPRTVDEVTRVLENLPENGGRRAKSPLEREATCDGTCDFPGCDQDATEEALSPPFGEWCDKHAISRLTPPPNPD